jgi:hypothetical protein
LLQVELRQGECLLHIPIEDLQSHRVSTRAFVPLTSLVLLTRLMSVVLNDLSTVAVNDFVTPRLSVITGGAIAYL